VDRGETWAACWERSDSMRPAQVGVGVEEVEADSSRSGDGPEVDLLRVLDELADRGLGAGRGSLPLGLSGAAQRVGSALCGGAWCAGGAHDGLGLVVMVTGTGVFW
jgi:hypothetical protein